MTTPPPDPGIGRDEWVGREVHLRDKVSRVEQSIARLPAPGRFGLVVAAAVLLPIVVSSDYIIRVAVNTLIYALLALGLNLVVGWAGLLDLGYVAFYGFGAYSYALLSSNQFHVHWPTAASVPLIVAASALLGILIGLPSRRLLGDYLAILTLFFAQAFVTLVANANRITPPGHTGAVDFTGGPNGIAGVDNMHLGSQAVHTVRGYFYLALIVFVIVVAALYSLNNSRTGRAWRSLREDPLAAQLMGMPVNWLKLTAFAFGAAIAGLTGTIFAALQVGVFPANFDISLLITIYAMVILGGAGSMTGVVLGAITINVVLEILRTPDPARMVFYAFVVAALLTWMRPYRRLALVTLNKDAIPANVTVTIIPSANPDGVYKVTGKEGRFTEADVSTDKTLLASARFNANNVDLNRNFACNWQPKSTWQSKTVSAGTSAFSEPEAQAIRDLALKYKPAAFIFWHSQSNAVYASQCNGPILPGTLDIMNAYGKAAGYPVAKTFDSYAITGDVGDWLSTQNIPAITVELKTHETIEWDKNLAGIKALLSYFGKKI